MTKRTKASRAKCAKKAKQYPSQAKPKSRTISKPKRASARSGPTLEECLQYGKKSVAFYIDRHASHLPKEQKTEILQDAALRVIEAHSRLDPSRGWKSFVQCHARGSVLDYLAAGDGFEEAVLMAAGGEDDGGKPRPDRLKFRITVPFGKSSPSGTAMYESESAADDSIDHLLGRLGVFSEGDEVVFNPNWPLISRMASIDRDIHLLAKILMGCTQAELAESFGVTRERLSQRIRLLFEKLDSPQFYNNKWVKQTIFAFGIWELYSMDPVDQGLGWNLTPVNLFNKNSVQQMKVDLRVAML
jgi:hypothetical protein